MVLIDEEDEALFGGSGSALRLWVVLFKGKAALADVEGPRRLG
jgi:hypothetical protein